jgi:endonuclease/exonuclease/phosphatase family metal-dependent hydrolase
MLWIIALLFVVVLLFAYQGYAAKNYLDPNAPFYSGNYAMDVRDPVGSLTVISYNIGYSLKIDRAIIDIKQIDSLRGLDILLLQEMDEPGVEQVARELHLNYVYYPAAVESTYRKDFGNAVLSRWPIVDARKLILPHMSYSNRMKRAATRATIRIEGEELIAYSIHTEPVFILPHYKEEQCVYVLQDLDPQARRVVAGGDFNSFTQAGISKLERYYQTAGLERASKGSGSTFARWGIKMSPDHIFTKGFAIQDQGKLEEATASDHLPIWVALKHM